MVPAFQEVLAQTLMELAESDEHIVAITPAMLSGSGLHKFAARFPQRCFDVGIAEQHAVTMAAGLAADGFKPVVHLYSTFAQRAYDQIIHDVVLQKLPVVFCLDRAGLVGQDGGTHHGAYDPGFLNTLPGVTIAAPLDGMALQGILTMALEDSSPWFIRYPKASFNPVYQQVPKDKQARQLKSGKQRVVLSFGAIGNKVIEALEGSEVAHYDFAFLNPLDCKALANIAKNYSEIFTVEENSARGGLGDTVRACLEELNYTTMVYSRSLPNYFMKHATRVELLADAGLDTQGLKEFLGLA
ncbi:MAG: transketolase C-terminal domain-containing protein [Owenweeksia sp.]|nr:transketolase C-terminal domain-containing protein [Owenweeksia sp.]